MAATESRVTHHHRGGLNVEALAGVEQLFGARPKRRYAELTLPIAGHRVRIQSLTERETSEYQAAVLSRTGQMGSYSRQRLLDASRRLIVLCLVDTAGNRILNDTHVEQLAEWDAADTGYLYEECAKHVGLKTADIEELAKNSSAITVAG
jgi:hypothetical protein